MLVAAGGIVGGYALYIKDGKPSYEYNWFTQARYRDRRDRQAPGGLVHDPNGVRVRRRRARQRGNRHPVVNGAEVATGRVEKTEPARFSADETFDVGRDTGSPVSTDYQSPFPFTGVLKKVEITLGEDKLTAREQGAVRKMEAAAAQARH